MAVRWFVDPRQVFCLVGIGVRIAQRMGLHTDAAQFGLTPFEVEQRRRLWWALVAYDRRMGEMTGSTVTALSSGGDCRIPLNVNDSDLHVDGKELPTPHSGPTEMLFALTRIEIAMAVASDSNRDAARMNNPNNNHPEKSPSSSNASGSNSSSSRPATTIRLAGQDGPAYTLEGFCAHIEGTYLAQCDPKIPLHFFTLTMTRQALCKMRIIDFLVRRHNADPLPLEGVERNNLFLQATQMLEYDNVVQSSDSLRPFKWYSMHHFPFPAYMFLVQELRHRVIGPMVERAWDAISRNHSLRGLLNNFHSPMHVAFGSHFIKAWEAHEAALRASGRQQVVERPPFLDQLKQRAETRRRARAENRPDPASLVGPSISVPRSSSMNTNNNTPSDSGAMMTPTSTDPNTTAGPPMGSGSVNAADDPGEMDWSYLISGYGGADTANAFPPMGGFGSFGPFPGADMGPAMGGGGGGPLHHQMPPMGGGGRGPGPGAGTVPEPGGAMGMASPPDRRNNNMYGN